MQTKLGHKVRVFQVPSMRLESVSVLKVYADRVLARKRRDTPKHIKFRVFTYPEKPGADCNAATLR